MASDDDIDLEAGLDPGSRERSLERLDVLERKIDLELKRKSLLCCSGTVSRDALDYGVQTGFSVCVMLFAMHNLLNTEKFHEISVSILSMLIGVYVPQRRGRQDRQHDNDS